MLEAIVHQLRENFVIVMRLSHNPLYPQYIIVDKKNISDTHCQLGYVGYVVPVGNNTYKFYGQ